MAEKQHYAREGTPTGEIVHIDKATKGTAYYCVGCGGEMGIKNGNIREKHYFHKVNNGSDCETYLHKLAKERIADWLRTSPEVSITLGVEVYCSERDKCVFYKEEGCQKIKSESYNLKKRYKDDEVALEKHYTKNGKAFVADIFLPHKDKNIDDPIFIEILVTHECEDVKKESGIKIIEIKIKTEEDIDRIIAGGLEEPQCTPYNFPYIGESCNKENFKVSLRYYTIRDRVSGLLQSDCSRLVNDIPFNGLLSFVTDKDIPDLDKMLAVWAYTRYSNFKDCLLCKHSYRDKPLGRSSKLNCSYSSKLKYLSNKCSKNNPYTCGAFSVISDKDVVDLKDRLRRFCNQNRYIQYKK